MKESIAYNKWLIILVIGLLVFVVLLNFIVDPLDIYRIGEKKGFNKIKPEVASYSRLSKPIQTELLQPKSIAFGSSRVEYGMNMSHSAWQKPALNNALSGTSIYDISRLFQHAIATAPIETAVIGVDLFMFNVYREKYKTINEKVLATSHDGVRSPLHKSQQLLLTLFSKDIFLASLTTLRKQKQKEQRYTKYGQLINSRTVNKILDKGGFNRIFRNMTKKLPAVLWTECRDGRFSYQGKGENSLEAFRNILTMARDNNVQLKFFISPTHAWLLEAMDAIGLWQEFEKMKRTLVKEVALANEQAGKDFVELWDFSGYTSYTTEKVPVVGDNKTIMKWYIDPSHYSDDLGDIMLGVMLSNHNVSDDLGSMLRSDNIENHLSVIRTLRRQYRQVNTEVLTLTKKMAVDVLLARKKSGIVCD